MRGWFPKSMLSNLSREENCRWTKAYKRSTEGALTAIITKGDPTEQGSQPRLRLLGAVLSAKGIG